MEEKTKQQIAREFQLHERDTGSADVQIALLTDHINRLTGHLQKNMKDHGSRHGLLQMVSRRRSLLDYLDRTDHPRYQKLLKKLNLRK
ncbi:MAG: 30S ribosomal protein S15 [Verrucomicrobia bacterium]|nr:30S ribosomal protein S15 [Verrucomicrobiota bacterium]